MCYGVNGGGGDGEGGGEGILARGTRHMTKLVG